MNDMVTFKPEDEIGEEKRAANGGGLGASPFGLSALACSSAVSPSARGAISAAARHTGRDSAAPEPGADGAHGGREARLRTMLVTLPATTSAFATANIFARASGYVDKRNVDIGDRVKAGRASRRDHGA